MFYFTLDIIHILQKLRTLLQNSMRVCIYNCIKHNFLKHTINTIRNYRNYIKVINILKFCIIRQFNKHEKLRFLKIKNAKTLAAAVY